MRILKDLNTGKEYHIDLISVMFPNGKIGLRVEILNTDGFPDDLGTLIVVDGKLKVIQW